MFRYWNLNKLHKKTSNEKKIIDKKVIWKTRTNTEWKIKYYVGHVFVEIMPGQDSSSNQSRKCFLKHYVVTIPTSPFIDNVAMPNALKMFQEVIS